MMFLAAVVGIYALYRYNLRVKVKTRLAAIRAAGYPASCIELDDWYSIPEGADNAAPVIIKAFRHYNKWGGRIW